MKTDYLDNTNNFKDIIHQVKDRIDIGEMIRGKIQLNNQNKALCPFHEETTPSFSVNIRNQYFYCFGCGAGGDIFSFLQRYEKKSFWDVLTELSSQTGIQIKTLFEEERKFFEEKLIIIEILTETAKYYHNNLTDEARNYLENERKLTGETINRFQIGFACGGLKSHLTETCKYSLDLCFKAGVLRQKDDGQAHDYFYRRIILPNINKGRVVYLSGRNIDNSEPKYLHLPGEQKFLYNEEALGNNEIIIVEGFFDSITLNQSGKDSVALVSTSLKPEFAHKFSKSESIYLCLDGDEAGRKGIQKLGETFLDKAKVIQLPDGTDPDSFIRSNSIEDFSNLLELSQDFIQYEISLISMDTNKIELTNNLGPIMQQLARLDNVKAEAYLTYHIKPYFDLKSEDVEGYRRLIKKYQNKTEKVSSENRDNDSHKTYSAYFEGLIDIVEDKGNPVFLIKSDNQLSLIDKIKKDGSNIVPPVTDQIPWLLPPGEHVINLFKKEKTLPQNEVDAVLYDDLINYHRNISELPDEKYYDLLASWDLHTYFLENTQYTPIICLFAVPERGKSRTGKGAIYVAFRGVHVESLRDAYLVRVAHDLHASLFFDVKDIWKKAEANGSEDILLHRFEKGAKVPRVLYPDRGPHQDIVYYSIFGPTIIGTNEGVDRILETRAIQINMPETNRQFQNDVLPELAIPLKERLLSFRARHLGMVLPDILKPAGGRLGDILRPLVQIIKLVRPEREKPFMELIKELEAGRLIEKADSLEAQILLTVLGLKLEVEKGILPVKLITDTFNTGKPERYQYSYQRIGRRLTAMGFKKGKSGDGGAVVIWDSGLVDRVKTKYGIGISSETPETSDTSEESKNSVDNTVVSDLSDVSGTAAGEDKKQEILIDKLPESEIKIEEEKLRKLLQLTDKNSKEYQSIYSNWFQIREKGVKLGIFNYFVSDGEEVNQ